MSERIQAIVMPKLGLSMTEGMVSKWHVTAGTKVEPGDIIADIETSKITNELEVHQSGIIGGELIEEGIDVPVGSLIGLLVQEDVSEEEIQEFIAGFSVADIADPEQAIQSEAPVETQKAAIGSVQDKESAKTEIPESLKGGFDDEKIYATHLARKMGRKLGIDLGKITGTGRRERISINDIRRSITEAGGSLPLTARENSTSQRAIPVKDDLAISATPLARKMAKQEGISLADIQPTGRKGRVSKKDVEDYISKSRPSESVPSGITGSYEEVKMSSMRKTIGQRMSASKQQAPHFRLTIEAVLDQILDLRLMLNKNARDDHKISLNDVLVKAVAKTLIEVPEVNSQYDGESIRRFASAHVAVAVALDEGLLTPIVRDAQEKSIVEISRCIKDLGSRAKTGRLLPDEIEGGTFTVSNLGMFGIHSFDAIINPPQVAILAIGAGEKQQKVVSGVNQMVTVARFTLSCDHRVLDGAIGARFLKILKSNIEHPYELI